MITLSVSPCWPSSQARVTSAKSMSSARRGQGMALTPRPSAQSAGESSWSSPLCSDVCLLSTSDRKPSPCNPWTSPSESALLQNAFPSSPQSLTPQNSSFFSHFHRTSHCRSQNSTSLGRNQMQDKVFSVWPLNPDWNDLAFLKIGFAIFLKFSFVFLLNMLFWFLANKFKIWSSLAFCLVPMLATSRVWRDPGTRPDLFFNYPTRPVPKIENDRVAGN